VSVQAGDLLDVEVPDGDVTDDGVSNNVSVGLQYLESWLRGVGAAAVYNLMEDAATAEIARAQVWQWIRHGKVAREHVRELEEAELERLAGDGRWDDARAVFDQVALGADFVEFLTLPAYEYLD
jgi:malate synthase